MNMGFYDGGRIISEPIPIKFSSFTISTGVCGDVDSPIACTATKVRQKRVQMTVKTHLHGRDSKERLKELILDEHEECACQCNDLMVSKCAGTFNDK